MFRFFHAGHFRSQLSSTAGRTAGLRNDLSHRAQITQALLMTHPSFATPRDHLTDSPQCYLGTSEILETYMKCQTKFASD